MVAIIARIALAPATVRPGESTRVEVLDSDDKLLSGESIDVAINGVPGGLQYLQFPSVGERRLVVQARAPNGDLDTKIAFLNVTGEPVTFPSLKGINDIAMLGVTQVLGQAYTAVLTLGSLIDIRTPHQLNASPSVPLQKGRSFARQSIAARLATRGVLARTMADHPHAMLKTVTRRLSHTRDQMRSKRKGGSGRHLPASTRRSVGVVYDLTDIDMSHIFKNPRGARALEFEWDFGDGERVTTRTPVVRHDYFTSINHAAGLGQFIVTCHVKHAGLTVQRTLTVNSPYAICKRVGTIVPHVTSELFAYKRYNMFNGMFTVHNVEDNPLVLDRVSITPTLENTDAIALPYPFIKLQRAVSIAPKSATVISVNIPFVENEPQAGQLRYDIKGFSVLYAGASETHPVRCGATFDVPVREWRIQPRVPKLKEIPPMYIEPWPWEIVEEAFKDAIRPEHGLDYREGAVLDKRTGTLAVSLGSLHAARDRTHVSKQVARILSTVYAPVERAISKVMMSDVSRVRTGQDAARLSTQSMERKWETTAGLAIYHDSNRLSNLDGPPPPGLIAEGQICEPDNLSEEDLERADQEQLVCQLTEERTDVLMPGRWMNARKGDCILSPGGDGIIGGLMLNVMPAQWFSHSGIMTRNYDEITHSTGSQRRVMDHLVGTIDGSDGFEPSVLKYVWPGAIVQSVQHSIEGEEFSDPEYDKSYSISSFGAHTVGITHNDQMKMITPLVLKPDPANETAAIRTALHAIASDARANAGRPGKNSKFHYRWYCYTDPTIGLGAPEGDEAGWAAGTRPSVCSSYIWLHAKSRNARLESDKPLVTQADLEQSDITDPLTGGASVSQSTVDGLYYYTAAERASAANWLYHTIHNQAFDKAGWFGELLTDGADDVANQFLNAFGSDDADGKDSDAWKTVTGANAVSPDNMLWWDSPLLGGLYGFAEPAIYREPRIESFTVSRWKKVLNRGSIRGKVFGPHGVIGGAIVHVHDGKETHTENDGTYALHNVPLGDYGMRSSAVVDGILYSAKIDIRLDTADHVVDIYLQPPEARFRIAQISVNFYGKDDETFSDEITDPGPEYFELELGPDKVINVSRRSYQWGGEVRIEFILTARLLANNAIDLQVEGSLYEGTGEDTEDLDGQAHLSFQVEAERTGAATLTITNTDEDDDDAGVLSISMANVRNSN